MNERLSRACLAVKLTTHIKSPVLMEDIGNRNGKGLKEFQQPIYQSLITVQLYLCFKKMYSYVKLESHDPRKSFSEFQGSLQTRPVEVIVGKNEDKQTFWIHRGIVCERSAFFKGALGGTWREAIDQKIHLPEDDPKIFALYQHLIYNGTLPTRGYPEEECPAECPAENNESSSHPSDDSILLPNIGPEYEVLTTLYVFCEKILDRDSKRTVLDAIIGRANERVLPHVPCSILFPDEKHINIIYDGTAEGDKARQVLVDMYAEWGDESWLTDCIEDWHPEFISDLSARMIERGFGDLKLVLPPKESAAQAAHK
jgi:hypothetical protein